MSSSAVSSKVYELLGLPSRVPHPSRMRRVGDGCAPCAVRTRWSAAILPFRQATRSSEATPSRPHLCLRQEWGTRGRRTGFTLLELAVVVTLMTVLVGVSTLSARGMTELSRVEAAGMRIGSLHRLALIEANRSHLPRLVTIEPHGCVISKPVLRDDAWTWLAAPPFRWPDGVRVVSVTPDGGEVIAATETGSWRLPIAPGHGHPSYRIEVRTSGGTHAVVSLDGSTSAVRTELIADD